MNNRLRKLVGFLWIAAAVALVQGCYDRLDLEEASSPFLVGYDLDTDNNMLVYVTNPIFGKHRGKKMQKIVVEANTSREAREQEDARSAGAYHGRKLQIVLIGKRMLQHADWFRMMDVYFRDSRNTLTPSVVVYNGPLSDIIYLDKKEQPMLPMLLRGMIDAKSARSETVRTTLQELHRQLYEKGVTPYISEAYLDHDDIVLQGMALLDHKGKYVVSLNGQETVLMQILQKEAKKSVSLTIPIPGESKRGPFYTDRLSLSTQKVNTNIVTSYAGGRFHFDIRVDMRVALTEILFPYHAQDQQKQLESSITSQVQKQFDDLVRKIKQYRIDPIGLGLYARAAEYKRFKNVEDHWGEAVAEADIRVTVSLEIGSSGPVK
ncbi:Ger(x)C family spore germination protein [Paenibacillus mesophilus]|uniref:Ger(x)C family spore germination protein n=1 Tax=Paenibacillus mesophilus TaxID=2582849 RepID=UPI00110EFFF9|nr:Ger(x)C family spore germination protein [Paenibacillus mesophilus]TMV50006.1 Ger(x)C family spore germination protein [Paenibacillus mesophilus]